MKIRSLSDCVVSDPLEAEEKEQDGIIIPDNWFRRKRAFIKFV